MAKMTDGTTNTICIVEQSDWLTNTATGNSRFDGRSSGAGTVGDGCAACPGYGWSMGNGTMVFGDDRQHGLTTMQHRPGTKKFNGRPAGINADLGANFPIQSAHTGGSQILLGDGSVRFISDNIDFNTALSLACRDDGNTLGEF